MISSTHLVAAAPILSTHICSRYSNSVCGARIRSRSGSRAPRTPARVASAVAAGIGHFFGTVWIGTGSGTHSPASTGKRNIEFTHLVSLSNLQIINTQKLSNIQTSYSKGTH